MAEFCMVIPAYRPGPCLPDLVHTLAAAGHRVLVVDDGSGAGFDVLWQAIRPECTLLRHPQNRGKGAALKTAFAHLKKQGFTGCVVTLDADGQHLPEDAARTAAAAFAAPGTLVLGCRVFDGKVPLRSLLGNKLTRSVFSLVAGKRVSDTQTGLRAFDASLLDWMLAVPGSRYEYEMNMLLQACRDKIPLAEVPIRTIYLDDKNSSSHFNGLRDSARIYGCIFKFALSSFAGFLVDYVLFLLLIALLPATSSCLMLANVAARVVSSGVNYTLNTRAVFRNNAPISRTLPRYILLAVGILLANSLILSLLVRGVGLPAQLAKIVTELVLFLGSFVVQSRFIFCCRSFS